jgi:hypothetical protein
LPHKSSFAIVFSNYKTHVQQGKVSDLLAL